MGEEVELYLSRQQGFDSMFLSFECTFEIFLPVCFDTSNLEFYFSLDGLSLSSFFARF